MGEHSVIIWDEEQTPVAFGANYMNSEAFKALFKEGMGLVEATAAYLDGQGREDARQLERCAALAYASESMRLTTRLMQIASWLLVQRAVAEGEITPEQAREEKARVRLSHQDITTAPELFDTLPEQLKTIVADSMRLHSRILHLDQLTSERAPLPIESPVSVQQWLLQSAFGARR